MEGFLRKHPWTVLAAGAAIQILTGVPAAWGVFQAPVRAEYGFDEAAASFVLSLLVGFYGLGCVLGGFLQDKTGPRPAALLGTALLAGGFFAAGFAPAGRPWLFYLAFCAPAGLGSAFLYPAVMGCAQKWYAARKGLATGVIGAAAGASGGALTLLVGFFSGRWGMRACFWALGGILLAVCAGASLLLQNPRAPAAKAATAAAPAPGPELGPRQMLRTRRYWLLFAATALASPAVLLFSPVIIQLGQDRGLPEGAARLAVAIGSAGSAAGRLALPAASDRWGRRAADLVAFAALAGLSAAFAFAGGWWVIAVYAALTFFYSGEAAVLPSLCTDLFGLEHTGVNYGFLALGMSAGSIAFPLAARWLGLESGRHWLAAFAAAAGFCCLLALCRVQKGKGKG